MTCDASPTSHVQACQALQARTGTTSHNSKALKLVQLPMRTLSTEWQSKHLGLGQCSCTISSWITAYKKLKSLSAAGAVVAVSSSLHKPHTLQFKASGAGANSPDWVPLQPEGGWPYDRAVEEALPNCVHQILQVRKEPVTC